MKGVHCCPRAQRWTGRSAFLLTQTGVLSKVLPAIIGSPSALPFPYPGMLLFRAYVLKSLRNDENEQTARGWPRGHRPCMPLSFLVCIFVCPVRAWWVLGTPAVDGCELLWQCWELNPGPPRELNHLSSPHPSDLPLITLEGAHTGNSRDYSQRAVGGCCNV